MSAHFIQEGLPKRGEVALFIKEVLSKGGRLLYIGKRGYRDLENFINNEKKKERLGKIQKLQSVN